MKRRRPPLAQRPLAFVDVETTGLDPDVHEIVEIAIVEQHHDGRLTEWSSKVIPLHIERAHPRALEVNGYNDEDWAGAPTFAEIADEVHERLRGRVMVGHNIHFDLSFIKNELGRCGVSPRIGYHFIDTIGLSFVWLAPQGLPNLRLDTIRERLDLSKVGAHGALKDARDCRVVYNSFVQQYHPQAVAGRLQALEEERERLRRRVQELEGALAKASRAEVLMFPGCGE